MKQTIILIAALLSFGTAYAGDTGLGTSPFSTGGSFTATQANTLNDQINDNAGDIAELVTLSGVAADSEDLGSGFTGSTIPDDSTIYEALQAIETVYETHAADPTAHVAPEAYDTTGWDNDFGAASKHDVKTKIESLGLGAGDVTSVLDCLAGACSQLSQAPVAFSDGDTTPDVSSGNFFITANTGATVISDFDTSLVNGQFFFLIVNDALTTFDLTSSGLEGVGGKDYTASSGDLVVGVYSTVDSQWHLLFWPSTISVTSLQEGITWADADGTGSLAWAFAFGADRTITIPGDADQTLMTVDSTASPTNKTIDADDNVLADMPLNGLLDGAITDPADADDMIYKKTEKALTLSDIHCLAEGGGSIALTLQECTSAGTSCSDIEGAITCDADGAEDDGTLTDASIAAGAWIKVLFSAPTGTVNSLAWTVYGKQSW